MPTYEYECLSCGHNFDKFQNMSDEPLKSCPKCSQDVKRLVGMGSGIIFKGSGFYATDYRKGSSQAQNSPKKESCPMANSKGCSGCSH